MDNGKTNSAAYLLKPHGNFPLSIIHYQFSKFHNLFLTQRQFLHSFRCYNPRVFDTNGTNARQNNFRLQCKDHTRLQLLLHTRSQYRHFIDFQTDAMTDKLVSAANAQVQEEAVAALTMLGFAQAPSQKVVLAILKEEPSAPVEQVIKLALKRL